MKRYCSIFLLAILVGACQSGNTQTGATASADDCIDPRKVNPDAMCTMDYKPVCGCNGKTYSNACMASNAGVRTFTEGPCPEKTAK
ncbi:hypothetical protein GCM10023185_45400 [Hymenobacter saemangeumensis]|uniref:Kazal-like domain-containing protein n=1 Tax=Hymenobacter saemangeumensis TaxID=1084522 RepID=A0ABP8ITQ7_9BACT